MLPTIQFQFLSDPAALLDGFSPSGEIYLLAARLEGSLTSAFPGGPPATGADSNDEAADQIEPTLPTHLTSTDSANIILVGDVDILSDRLWAQSQNFFGQQLITA